MTLRAILLFSSMASGAIGTAILGDQLWLHVKAGLAERLIGRAFDAHLADGREHAPWAWADVTPIARLEVPRLGVSRIVLSGASGSSLAFGLGHVDGTARPGTPGNCAIAAHRDSWGHFLAELTPGDDVRLTTRAGTTTYRVEAIDVVPQGGVDVLAPDGATRLTLISCWPFDGVRRSPWRVAIRCATRRS